MKIKDESVRQFPHGYVFEKRRNTASLMSINFVLMKNKLSNILFLEVKYIYVYIFSFETFLKNIYSKVSNDQPVLFKVVWDIW